MSLTNTQPILCGIYFRAEPGLSVQDAAEFIAALSNQARALVSLWPKWKIAEPSRENIKLLLERELTRL